MEVSSLIKSLALGECTQSPVPLLSQEFGGVNLNISPL